VNGLDTADVLALDRSGMFDHIRDVGHQLALAWEASEELVLPAGAEDAVEIVVAGVGGSATAGDYFASICRPHAAIPVRVVRGYSLPNHVSDRSLVAICSYSGDTAEALACYDDAWKRGASLMAITRGGALAARAGGDAVPVWRIGYEAAPRATTVHTLAPLLRAGRQLGVAAVDTHEIRAAGDRHRALVERELAPEVPAARNGAKRLAMALRGRIPFILGGEHLAPAAVRFKNQLGENGKTLAAADTLPEAGHNVVVGLATAPAHRELMSFVVLEARQTYEPRLMAQLDGFTRQCDEAGLPVHRLTIEGETILEQLLQATAWGDYVSCYLALAQGFDPTPVPQIERLRRGD
jgi:glucose/mannose-6-phosphate isomerase